MFYGKVADYETATILIVNKTQSIKDAAEIMGEHDIGAVLVGDNSKPVGIFTERDFLRLAPNTDMNTLLSEVMTKKLITISKDAPIGKAIEKMINKGIRRLIVIDADGEIAGFLSIRDVLRAAYDTYIESVEY